MEINTSALTSHSKHNGSRIKYYAYNLTIPKCRISSNNDGSCRGRLFLFSHIKGVIVRRKVIISNIAYWKSCPKYFVYNTPKSKNNHIE